MRPSKYEPLDIIGKGSFSTVRKVRRISDGKLLVRKEISCIGRRTPREELQIQQEIKNLSLISHRNIVQYHDKEFDAGTNTLYIYMDYCGKGDLSQLIEKCREEKSRFDERWIWSVFAQLVSALYTCHNGHPPNPPNMYEARRTSDKVKIDRVVLHRDIKPENVFIDNDNLIKLGDFGLSKALTKKKRFTQTYVGTPYYMSPEVINGLSYSSEADIWALGCVIYELCTLKPPFDANSLEELNSKIGAGHVEKLDSVYSSDLFYAIRRCLQKKATERPSAADLLEIAQIHFARVQLDFELQLKKIENREKMIAIKEQELEIKQRELTRREMTFQNLELMLRREREHNKKVQDEYERQLQSMRYELARRQELILPSAEDSPMQVSPIGTKQYESPRSGTSEKSQDFPKSISTPHKLSSLAIKSMTDLRSPLSERNGVTAQANPGTPKMNMTPTSRGPIARLTEGSGRKSNLGSPSRELRKKASGLSVKTQKGSPKHFLSTAKSFTFLSLVQRKRQEEGLSQERAGIPTDRLSPSETRPWLHEPDESLPSPFLRKGMRTGR